jgi:transcriptional regulator with XRE-family HTH domain
MPESDRVMLGGYPLADMVRRVRRTADLSQRELARFAGVSRASLGAIESGARTPSLAVLQRILHAANYMLVVADACGRLAAPLEVWQDVRDGADRRYPAHLDTIIDPEYGEWWGDVYGLARPPETYYRNRAMRDWKRRCSQWDVRHRGEPPWNPPH